MLRRSSIPTALSLLALSLAACGDDGGGSASSDDDDRSEIARVVERAFTTQDAKVTCEQLASESFVTRVYGGVAQCMKAEKPDPEDKPPTDVSVSGVTVDGNAGTARSRFVGGDLDAVAGTVEVRKEDGEWTIDDLGADLLRSVFKTGLETELEKDKTFNKPNVRACATKLITDQPDDKIKRFGYDAIGEREGSDEEIAKLLAPCLTLARSGEGPGNRSVVRETFEAQIRRGARQDGLPRSVIDCAIEKLRSSISDEELSSSLTAKGQPTAKVQRAIVAAITACGATGAGSTTQ